MRGFLRVLVAVLFCGLLSQLIAIPAYLLDKYKPVCSIDLVVAVMVMAALAKTRLGRPSVWLVSIAWTLVVLFEWARAVGIEAMKQAPLLYDAYFLGTHLYILLRDLMGFKATLMMLGVGGALLGLGIVSHLMLRWISRGLDALPIRYTALFVASIGGLWLAAEETRQIRERTTLPEAVDNLVRSVEVYQEIKRGVREDVYEDLAAVELTAKPRVHIYIVESYGRAILSPPIRDEFVTFRRALGERFKAAGWHVSTGLSDAPVMGGRSWLADATLLSGRTVKYESVYRHLTPRLKDIHSIPSFFRSRGYRTILMRPKDKARPGVELVNHFEFTDTVFHEDLDYRGKSYGWVEIPDQFALGHIRDVVLPTLGDTPEFVFAHLGSSHIPWDELPPVVDDWTTLQDSGRRRNPKDKALTDKEIKFQLGRFKRDAEVRLRRLRPTAENLDDYRAAIQYSLEVVTQHVLSMDTPPDLVVVMGDHQPPMYKNSDDFSVPVHVLSKNEALLQGFKDRGFSSSILYSRRRDRIRHEGFFSLLVAAMAEAQGVSPPEFRRAGIEVAK